MKSVWNSFLIAVSMYSRIPVPQADWNEKNMRYSLCFFPLIGAVIAAVCFGLYYLSEYLRLPVYLIGAVMTVVPIAITGGLHMDGFCDTTDALSSHQPRERKLEILKDSHTGAFAVIWCAVYFVLYFGCAASCTLQTYTVFLSAFVFARGLSAFSIANFPTAKEGLVSMFKNAGARALVTIISLLWLIGAVLYSVLLFPWLGCIVCVSGLLAYLCCVAVMYRQFGGISGDLAGWMVQIVEVVMLLAAAVGGYVL